MSKQLDLTGRRFGRLHVIAKARSDSQGHLLWLTVCDCGHRSLVNGAQMARGKIVRCERCRIVPTKVCENCHEPIPKKSRGRNGKYCSNKCRMERWFLDVRLPLRQAKRRKMGKAMDRYLYQTTGGTSLTYY